MKITKKQLQELIKEEVQKYKKTQQLQERKDNIKKQLNEDGRFGVVNIHIDGEGIVKNGVIKGIRKLLNNYQGERYLFIDGGEVNPYIADRSMS